MLPRLPHYPPLALLGPGGVTGVLPSVDDGTSSLTVTAFSFTESSGALPCRSKFNAPHASQEPYSSFGPRIALNDETLYGNNSGWTAGEATPLHDVRAKLHSA